MAGIGSKTPVSILNEYALKKGYLPKYELLGSGRGLITPVFVYAVQLNDQIAMGEGRSKQEAKHQAARKMLEVLKIAYDSECENLVVPHEDSVRYNAVGALSEFCGRTCYPEPIYEVISDVGLPHEKTFTVKCTVSKLIAIAESRTKKEAKQNAANKMLKQLQQEAGEEPMAVAIPKKAPVDISDELELPRVTPVYQPQAQLYKDFCNAYIGLEEKSETLTNIINDWSHVTLQNACDSLRLISLELAVAVVVEKVGEHTYHEMPLSVLKEDYSDFDEYTYQEPTTCIFITLQLHPPVVNFGRNVPGAALNLLEYLREFCT